MSSALSHGLIRLGVVCDLLGGIKVTDDQTGSEDLANYEVVVETAGKAVRTFRLENHRRAGGIWLLAFQVLQLIVRPTVTMGSPRR